MTTPRDLMIIALDVAPSRPVERGELSLALAGAELIDLLAAGAATLDGEQIVPGDRTDLSDGLLDEAGSALLGQARRVGRRLALAPGPRLSPAYVADLEATGGSRLAPAAGSAAGRPAVPVDTADRRRPRNAGGRMNPSSPRSPPLPGSARSQPKPLGPAGEDLAEETVTTVLAAVGDAFWSWRPYGSGERSSTRPSTTSGEASDVRTRPAGPPEHRAKLGREVPSVTP